MIRKIRKQAPAKINLTLRVTGKRQDGLHLLESIIVFADIADELYFSKAAKTSLRTEGPFAENIPTNDTNLAIKTLNLIRKKYQIRDNVLITIKKNLPVGAGIGGGSSDAASTINGLSELFNLGMDDKEKNIMALELGADVPVCLHGRPAFVSGVGEIIDGINSLPGFWAVLIFPMIALSTRDVFSKGFKSYSMSYSKIPATEEGWQNFLKNNSNDMEYNSIRIVPQISEILDELRKSDQIVYARMSGSGSACFGLFDTKAGAERCARRIARIHPQWWIKTTRLKGSKDT